jgi:hypothetical protein
MDRRAARYGSKGCEGRGRASRGPLLRTARDGNRTHEGRGPRSGARHATQHGDGSGARERHQGRPPVTAVDARCHSSAVGSAAIAARRRPGHPSSPLARGCRSPPRGSPRRGRIRGERRREAGRSCTSQRARHLSCRPRGHDVSVPHGQHQQSRRRAATGHRTAGLPHRHAAAPPCSRRPPHRGVATPPCSRAIGLPRRQAVPDRRAAGPPRRRVVWGSGLGAGRYWRLGFDRSKLGRTFCLNAG